MKKSIGSGRGSVYNILLKALQTGDKYGYEICKEVEEKTNGSYILKQPSLYSGLKRLEAQGDITSYWRDSALGGRRHYYSLTEKGRERINGSNFSWTDARDDIVGSLFEMSETDSQIDNLTSQIDSLKSVYEAEQESQDVIDEVIKRTDSLINENQHQSAEAEQESQNYSSSPDTQADDLFSIFTNFDFDSNNSEHKDIQPIQQESELKIDNDTEISLELNDNLPQESETENSFETENDVENQNQTSLFSMFDKSAESENLQIQPSDEEKHINETETKQEENNIEFLQDESHIETGDISKENTNENQTDFAEILNNLQTVDTTEENKVSTLQKNQENVLDDYFNSHISFGGFSDSTQLEEPEQNFSIYDDNVMKSLFSFDEEIDKKDATITPFKNNDNENEANKVETEFVQQDDDVQNLFKNNTGNIEAENKAELNIQNIEEKIENSAQNADKSFDYRDIFGDLMSTNSDDSVSENTEKTQNIEKVEAQDLTENIKMTTTEKQTDDLPRIDAKNDINRTLFFDSRIVDITNKTFENSAESHSSDFERYDQTPFETDGRNPFEKYDTYTQPEKIDENAPTSQQFVHTDYVPKPANLSFDKKYLNDNNSFDVPDYEVRYHKKIDISKSSKFLSINKLNLLTSSILFLFIYFITTLTLILSNRSVTLPGFQIAIYVLAYVLGFAILLKDFVKFLINKDKKAHMLNKNEKIYNFAFAVVIALLAICINLIAGINFGKFAYYTGGFMVPIYYAIALIIKYPIRKFLSGFGNFYN